MPRAVASLSLPGGQDRMISSIFPHFPVASLIFLQFFFIFFLILVFWVGGSPTRKDPGYATVHAFHAPLQYSFLCQTKQQYTCVKHLPVSWIISQNVSSLITNE